MEDIQWSPAEGTVFSSCSSDCTVRIWDTRGRWVPFSLWLQHKMLRCINFCFRNGPQITWTAHQQDVNVISWNKSVGYLLASGSDDGTFKVGIYHTYLSCTCVIAASFLFKGVGPPCGELFEGCIPNTARLLQLP